MTDLPTERLDRTETQQANNTASIADLITLWQRTSIGSAEYGSDHKA
jgi:hypothetical protein